MRKNVLKSLSASPVVFTIVLFLAACAGLQKQFVADCTEGERTVTMKASNFKFEPNNILTYRGDTIRFEVRNVSDTEHNFTIADPGGNVLQNVDVLPGKTIYVTVTFSRQGIYHFHCDEFLHSFLGMKGRVEVVEEK